MVNNHMTVISKLMERYLKNLHNIYILYVYIKMCIWNSLESTLQSAFFIRKLSEIPVR